MNKNVNDLIELLNIDVNTHTIKYKHHFKDYKWFPFVTRAPERYKFDDDFLEVTGIMARISDGNSPKLSNLNEIFLENLRKNIEIEDNISDNRLLEIFQTSFKDTKRAQLLPYIPITNSKDQLGKIEVARLLVELLDLDSNDEWHDYIASQNINNLYSQLLKESLPVLEKFDKVSKKFNLINKNYYQKLFAEDFHILMASGNVDFISQNINLLFSFYYIIYILYTGTFLFGNNNVNKKYYFAYEKEQISRSRRAISDGYADAKELSADILIDVDITDYLNILFGNVDVDDSQTFKNKKKISDLLRATNDNLKYYLDNLQEFKDVYAELKGHNYNKQFISEDKDTGNILKKEIIELRDWLKKDESLETQKRYRKSYDEIKHLNYLKSRGSLGNVLNASQELILLFTAIIVGNEEHLLLRHVFEGFEKHGLFFDKASKNSIIRFYEEVNLLEKMSDSGDAQYVKSIL